MKSWIPAESDCDGGPFGAHRGWRLTYDFAPLGRAVGDEDYVANLGGFQSGSGDAGLLDQLLDFGEAGEFETSANAAILADFCRELLLSFNPRAIERRQKFGDAAFAQRRRGVAGEQVAQGLELEQARTAVGDRIGHEGHACDGAFSGAFSWYNAGQISVGDDDSGPRRC